MPDWSGWVSQTTMCCELVRPFNIQAPITDVSVDYQGLLKSMNVSYSPGQKFTFVTFDFAAAKLALNIV